MVRSRAWTPDGASSHPGDFVAPGWARRGIGGRLLDVCRAAAEAEGFTSFELMATLPGVPLYARKSFREVERVKDRLPSGVVLEFVRMRR